VVGSASCLTAGITFFLHEKGSIFKIECLLSYISGSVSTVGKMDSNTGKHNYSAIMDTDVSLNSIQSSPRDRVELPETEEERSVTVVIECCYEGSLYCVVW
jgi:hypothetical protein